MYPVHDMRATVSRAPTVAVPPGHGGHSMQQQWLKIVASPGNSSGTDKAIHAQISLALEEASDAEKCTVVFNSNRSCSGSSRDDCKRH